MAIVEQVAGAVVTVVVLLDMFLTVLYARAGTELLSPVVARTIWLVFRLVARPLGRHRGRVLTFCGPVILIALIFVWAAGLALGAGLIMHHHLGEGIRASQGSTPTDFMSALYAGASSLSFVGSGDFTPQSAVFQALYMLNSLIGISVMSLVLMYVMQIYNALKSRNALGLAIQTLSDDSGDAAELIVGLGPDGQLLPDSPIFRVSPRALPRSRNRITSISCCSFSGLSSPTTRFRGPPRYCSTPSRCSRARSAMKTTAG
jgi:hypothetical protein